MPMNDLIKLKLERSNSVYGATNYFIFIVLMNKEYLEYVAGSWRVFAPSKLCNWVDN